MPLLKQIGETGVIGNAVISVVTVVAAVVGCGCGSFENLSSVWRRSNACSLLVVIGTRGK